MTRRLLAPVAVAASVMAPAAAAAQTCGVAAGIAAAGGYAAYEVASTSGATLGADAAVDAGPVLMGIGYRRVILEGDAAQPDIVRGSVTVPVASVSGVTACVTGHAGGTLFTLEDDAGGVLAGGVGVTLATTQNLPVQPFVSVRGLGARATGTVLGIDVDASGLSVGVEAGVAAAFGPVAFRVAGSMDGFDDGLGVTAYPAQSIELAIGIRF